MEKGCCHLGTQNTVGLTGMMCKDNHISLAAGGEQHRGEEVSFIQIQFPNYKFQMIAKF